MMAYLKNVVDSIANLCESPSDGLFQIDAVT